MYKCNDCGYEFEEPKEVVETYGFNTPPYKRLYLCPHCNENDIKEIIEVECSRCGRCITKDEAEIDDSLQYLCNECYDDIFWR